jgi:hypothetical protein
VTGQRSNQLSYTPAKGKLNIKNPSHPVKAFLGRDSLKRGNDAEFLNQTAAEKELNGK